MRCEIQSSCTNFDDRFAPTLKLENVLAVLSSTNRTALFRPAWEQTRTSASLTAMVHPCLQLSQSLRFELLCEIAVRSGSRLDCPGELLFLYNQVLLGLA